MVEVVHRALHIEECRTPVDYYSVNTNGYSGTYASEADAEAFIREALCGGSNKVFFVARKCVTEEFLMKQLAGSIQMLQKPWMLANNRGVDVDSLPEIKSMIPKSLISFFEEARWIKKYGGLYTDEVGVHDEVEV